MNVKSAVAKVSGAAGEDKFAKPHPIDDLTLAFPASVRDLMPPYQEIPDEFRSGSNSWVEWQMRWFYEGLKATPVAKDGIDGKAAMRHLSAIQSSWEPKHEHKQAGVAYLASRWFDAEAPKG